MFQLVLPIGIRFRVSTFPDNLLQQSLQDFEVNGDANKRVDSERAEIEIPTKNAGDSGRL